LQLSWSSPSTHVTVPSRAHAPRPQWLATGVTSSVTSSQSSSTRLHVSVAPGCTDASASLQSPQPFGHAGADGSHPSPPQYPSGSPSQPSSVTPSHVSSTPLHASTRPGPVSSHATPAPVHTVKPSAQWSASGPSHGSPTPVTLSSVAPSQSSSWPLHTSAAP